MNIEEKIKTASDDYAESLILKTDVYSAKMVRRTAKNAFEQGCHYMMTPCKKYILVEWPESQMLMDHERFHECIFVQDLDNHDQVGDSAYMCPEDLFYKLFEFAQSQ